MIVRSARFLLTRLFFLTMGLPIARYRKEVESLWSLSEDDRANTIERILAYNRPTNSAGAEVTGLESLQSSPSLSKKQLRAQAMERSVKNGRFRFGRHTAGTTGEPTKISLSRDDLARMLGVRDYCFRYYGVALGQREARFWGRPEYGFKSHLKNFVLNRQVCFPSGEGAKESVAKILNWAPDYIYGYASLLMEAAVIIENNSISFPPPKCVICTAETILPAQKTYLAKVFNAPVAEEYGATEFDVVAFECKYGHRHLVNPWLIITERNESLLITDSTRRSASLVNYEIGDTGSIEATNCSELGGECYLNEITGRSINRFVYIDPEINFHSVNLSYAINEFQKKEKTSFIFQIVQNEYGVIDVYVSNEVQERYLVLEEYMRNYLWNKTGKRIEVNVFENTKENRNSSKSYFIQNIDVPTDNSVLQ